MNGLQFYGKVIGDEVRDFSDPRNTLSERFTHFTNFMGRLPVVGGAVGVLRIAYGVAKAAACAFIALGAALTHCVTGNSLCNAKYFGMESVDGLKHIGRGFAEAMASLSIPFGCILFTMAEGIIKDEIFIIG